MPSSSPSRNTPLPVADVLHLLDEASPDHPRTREELDDDFYSELTVALVVMCRTLPANDAARRLAASLKMLDCHQELRRRRSRQSRRLAELLSTARLHQTDQEKHELMADIMRDPGPDYVQRILGTDVRAALFG